MPTKCETASLTAAPRDGGYHDHNADQLSHSPFLSAASWDSYLESSAAPQNRPEALHLSEQFGNVVESASAARAGLAARSMGRKVFVGSPLGTCWEQVFQRL